jgi:hypothetical protein
LARRLLIALRRYLEEGVFPRSVISVGIGD